MFRGECDLPDKWGTIGTKLPAPTSNLNPIHQKSESVWHFVPNGFDMSPSILENEIEPAERKVEELKVKGTYLEENARKTPENRK